MTDLEPDQTRESRGFQAVFNTPQQRTKEILLGLLVVQSIDPCHPHTEFSPSTVTCTSWPCLWAPGWSVTEHLYLPERLWVTQYMRTAWEPAGMTLWSVSVRDARCWSHPPLATKPLKVAFNPSLVVIIKNTVNLQLWHPSTRFSLKASEGF